MLIAAVLPAIVLMWHIYRRDAYHPEPISQLAKGFGWGLLCALLAMIVEIPLMYVVGMEDPSNILQCAYKAFVGAAIPEECCKALCLFLFLRRNKYFDEYMDGIVYAVCVGMGFAAVENVAYLMNSDNWVELGVYRALLSVPGHFMFAILMGYFFSIWRMEGHRIDFYFMLLAPILAHGVFNSIVFYTSLAPSWTLFLLALLAFLLHKLRKWCSSLIDSHISFDKELT